MSKNINFRLLQFATFAVFFGRGFQYLFRDVPLRVVLWKEEWMTPILAKFGIAWEDYATSPTTEIYINSFIQSIGYLYFIAAFSVFIFSKNNASNELSNNKKRINKIVVVVISVAVFHLLFLAFCYMKDSCYNLGQFFEFAIQIGAPVMLLFVNKIAENRLIFIVKILCALAFICHGLYAIGYYTMPVDYISMTMNGFKMQESSAKKFLQIIGFLDIITSILIFLPKIDKIALLYMIIWGFMTSVARVYANFHEEIPSFVIFQQYWFQTVLRFGHFLLPLMCFFHQKNTQITAHD